MKVSLSVLSPSIGPFFRRGRLIYAHKRDLSGRVVSYSESYRPETGRGATLARPAKVSAYGASLAGD
jgi:hypothetical protein